MTTTETPDLSSYLKRALYVLDALSPHMRSLVGAYIHDDYIDWSAILDTSLYESMGSGERAVCQAANGIYRADTRGVDLFTLPEDAYNRVIECMAAHKGR